MFLPLNPSPSFHGKQRVHAVGNNLPAAAHFIFFNNDQRLAQRGEDINPNDICCFLERLGGVT